MEEEVGQFQFQLVLVGHAGFGDLGQRHAPLAPRPQPHRHHLLLVEIHGQVAARLEDAHPPHVLHGDAAHRDVGGAAVGEHDAGIGDVGQGGNHRRAGGEDLVDVRVDDGEDDVDVVDHQVEHHVHVRAPLLEHGQPVRLDEQRVGEQRLHGQHRRVEPLQVADLEDAAALAGKRNEVVRLGQGGGDGLFHEHVQVGEQAGAGHLVVQHRGHDHAHRVHQGQQLPVIGERPGATFVRHLRRPLRVGISHAHQFHPGHFRVFLGMKPSQVADPDNPCFHIFCHAFCPLPPGRGRPAGRPQMPR